MYSEGTHMYSEGTHMYSEGTPRVLACAPPGPVGYPPCRRRARSALMLARTSGGGAGKCALAAPSRPATWGTLSTPARTWGTLSTPARTWGTLSTPARTWGTLSIPARTWGTLSTPARTWGTLSTPARTWGTLSIPEPLPPLGASRTLGDLRLGSCPLCGAGGATTVGAGRYAAGTHGVLTGYSRGTRRRGRQVRGGAADAADGVARAAHRAVAHAGAPVGYPASTPWGTRRVPGGVPRRVPRSLWGASRQALMHPRRVPREYPLALSGTLWSIRWGYPVSTLRGTL
jgi:hypothetical protein